MAESSTLQLTLDHFADDSAVIDCILLIVADDLGWMDVGFNNPDTFYDTPALDRLVNGGVSFDRAFDVVSTCSSSRATLVTGQYVVIALKSWF